MLLEIYTEKDVSKTDKERCIAGYRSEQFGKYTIVKHFYVVYKDVSIFIVNEICTKLITQ